MKKLLLILFLLAQLKDAGAQTSTYHPFPTDNAIWVNRLGHYNPPGIFDPFYVITIDYYDPYTYYCMGSSDTTIGSFVYSKLDSCGGPYQGGLRDDNGKIYFIPADSAHELLMYDFTVNAGDIVSVYSKMGNDYTEYTYHAGPVDSVLINGSYRKRIMVESSYWIEGIGNTNGLFRESWPNVSNYIIDLVCMSENDTALYPSNSPGACSFSLGVEEIQKGGLTVTIYPNPSEGNYELNIDFLNNTVVDIKDVLGKTVATLKVKDPKTFIDLTNQPQGIYFLMIRDESGHVLTKKIVKQ